MWYFCFYAVIILIFLGCSIWDIAQKRASGLSGLFFVVAYPCLSMLCLRYAVHGGAMPLQRRG
jgi:hypothetical protein